MQKKRYLVTGGAGFIGSHFVQQRVQAGDEVWILDSLTYAGNVENIAPFQTRLIPGDIRDARLVRKILRNKKINTVVNFAAESHVDRSIRSPAEFISTNINGTFTLLNESLEYWLGLDKNPKKDFRYVQVSTDEVFGSLSRIGKFNEKSRYQPNSPYSASKAAGDHLVRAWFETYGMPVITTHSSNNYGPRQNFEKLIPNIIWRALSNKPIPIYGDGKNIRDWIHVEDNARGIWLALCKGKPGDTFCLGANNELKNFDLAKILCDELDFLHPRMDKKSYRLQLTRVADRPGHDFRYAIDSGHAKKTLGFKPRIDFGAGLRETVTWYLNHPKFQ